MRCSLPRLIALAAALSLGGCWLSDAEIQERLDAEDTGAVGDDDDGEADTGLP